jgi:hypothetical protein
MKTLKSTFMWLIIFSISLIAVSSCSKDEDTDNPCASVTCENGGTCVNGSCDCPAGYGGNRCQTQKTPSKIRITKIQTTGFPSTDSGGAGWDLTSGADLTLLISDASSNTIWESDVYYEDASPSITYEFIPNPPLLLSPNTNYNMEVYDYDDFDPDDYMDGIIFSINFPNTSNFPSQIIFNPSGSFTSYRLYVEYIF